MYQAKFLDVSSAVFKQEISVLYKNKNQILHPIVFCILSIMIYRFAFGWGDIPLLSAVGFFLIIILLSLILVSQALLNDDYRNDFFAHYVLNCLSLEVVLIAKWFAYLLSLVLPLLLLLPLCIYMLCKEFLSFDYYIAILLFTINSSLILLCSSALLLGDNKFSTLSVISLPFHIPNIIFTIMYLQDPSYILMLLGLFLFYFPACILASCYVIKINAMD